MHALITYVRSLHSHGVATLLNKCIVYYKLYTVSMAKWLEHLTETHSPRERIPDGSHYFFKFLIIFLFSVSQPSREVHLVTYKSSSLGDIVTKDNNTLAVFNSPARFNRVYSNRDHQI